MFRELVGRLRGTSSDNVTSEPSLSVRTWLTILAAPFGFLVLAVIVHNLDGVPFGDISREPTVTLDGPPLLGVQSNLGILVWWTGASICLFAYALLRSIQFGGPRANFLFWAGLVTAFLALDDFFLLHEDLIFSVTGQSERRVFLAYGVVILVFMWRYRSVILSSRGVTLFVGAVMMLTTSILVDISTSLWADQSIRIFCEDGSKLVGIFLWNAYLVRHGYYTVIDAQASR